MVNKDILLDSRLELLLPRLQIECITNYANPTIKFIKILIILLILLFIKFIKIYIMTI